MITDTLARLAEQRSDSVSTSKKKKTPPDPLQTAANLEQKKGDAENDSASMFAGQLGQLIYNRKARNSYKSRDELAAESKKKSK